MRARTLLGSFLPSRPGRRRGVAAMEAAVLAPLLLVLVLCGADVVTWMRTSLRLEQVAAGTAATLSQYRTLYNSDFTATLVPAAQTMAGSIAVTGQDGGMILSGIVNNNDGKGAIVAWQYKSSTEFTSMVGDVGSATRLPSGYQVPAGQSVIAAEAFNQGDFYVYGGSLWRIWRGSQTITTLSAVSLYPTRSASLSSVTAGTRPAGVTP